MDKATNCREKKNQTENISILVLSYFLLLILPNSFFFFYSTLYVFDDISPLHKLRRIDLLLEFTFKICCLIASHPLKGRRLTRSFLFVRVVYFLANYSDTLYRNVCIMLHPDGSLVILNITMS